MNTPRTEKRIKQIEGYGFVTNSNDEYRTKFNQLISLKQIQDSEKVEWSKLTEPFSPASMLIRKRELIRSEGDNTEEIKDLNDRLDKFNYGY